MRIATRSCFYGRWKGKPFHLSTTFLLSHHHSRLSISVWFCSKNIWYSSIGRCDLDITWLHCQQTPGAQMSNCAASPCTAVQNQKKNNRSGQACWGVRITCTCETRRLLASKFPNCVHTTKIDHAFVYLLSFMLKSFLGVYLQDHFFTSRK